VRALAFIAAKIRALNGQNCRAFRTLHAARTRSYRILKIPNTLCRNYGRPVGDAHSKLEAHDVRTRSLTVCWCWPSSGRFRPHCTRHRGAGF
jgi:hypothetical protein